ncbi:MAG TPA: cardiolipin synthase [Methylomirabilota bacterium]|jgi:cardiolipin synthase|nr:cardiolipin synthase [Methylomirabilota bacterium]
MRRAHGFVGLLVVAAVVVAATACARVRPLLELPELALGEPSFFPTLEAYAGAPIVGGNRVEPLLNGQEIFPAKLAAIRSAKVSVTYAEYFFEDGPVAQELTEALAERCRARIPVHVLLDGFGSLAMPPEYGERMRAAGCEVVSFRPLKPFTVHRANKRNHRRILVVDGRLGFTGGSGVSSKWMGNGRMEGRWRDTDVRVEGPVVQHLQAAFVENWVEATGVVLGGEAYFPRPLPARGQVHAQVVRSSPATGSYAMYTTLLLAMASAQRSIHVSNPYFVPDDKLQEALVAAARRGVKVVALVPANIDHNLVRWASRRRFGPLLRAGIEIYEYQAAFLHAKTMVIDGVWSTVGSTNFDNRSFALNDELNLIVYDRAFGQRMEKIFSEDLAHSRPVDYRGWQKRGLTERLMEWLGIPLHDHL